VSVPESMKRIQPDRDRANMAELNSPEFRSALDRNSGEFRYTVMQSARIVMNCTIILQMGERLSMQYHAANQNIHRQGHKWLVRLEFERIRQV